MTTNLSAEDMFKKMERMMKDFQEFSKQFPASDHFFPADIRDKEGEIVLQAELPGVSKDDVNVRVTSNSVSIAAESEERVNKKDENYYRKEGKSQSYQRSFKLPETVEIDTDNVGASYENGILEIKLPKKKKKKRIEVE